MTFSEDHELKSELSRRAWSHSVVGKAGFVCMVALIAISPVNGFLSGCLLQMTWSGSYEFDPKLVVFVGVVTVVMHFFLAYVVRTLTWQYCNKEIGLRLGQQVRLEGRFLIYTYRMRGDSRHFVGGINEVVIDTSPGVSGMSLDRHTGLMTFWGDVRWRYVSGGINEQEQVSFDELEPLDGVRIPNCFVPNLYQALCATGLETDCLASSKSQANRERE